MLPVAHLAIIVCGLERWTAAYRMSVLHSAINDVKLNFNGDEYIVYIASHSSAVLAVVSVEADQTVTSLESLSWKDLSRVGRITAVPTNKLLLSFLMVCTVQNSNITQINMRVLPLGIVKKLPKTRSIMKLGRITITAHCLLKPKTHDSIEKFKEACRTDKSNRRVEMCKIFADRSNTKYLQTS